MPTLTEDEVRANLPAVIDALRPGEEVVVTRGGKPVARLVADRPGPIAAGCFPPSPQIAGRASAQPSRQPRKAGNCAGMGVIVTDDDIDLSEFAEYME
jgi:antitoxin (DNA-binding transcriptional repressor) of toxin-antitoxin stability system